MAYYSKIKKELNKLNKDDRIQEQVKKSIEVLFSTCQTYLWYDNFMSETIKERNMMQALIQKEDCLTFEKTDTLVKKEKLCLSVEEKLYLEYIYNVYTFMYPEKDINVFRDEFRSVKYINEFADLKKFAYLSKVIYVILYGDKLKTLLESELMNIEEDIRSRLSNELAFHYLKNLRNNNVENELMDIMGNDVPKLDKIRLINAIRKFDLSETKTAKKFIGKIVSISEKYLLNEVVFDINKLKLNNLHTLERKLISSLSEPIQSESDSVEGLLTEQTLELIYNELKAENYAGCILTIAPITRALTTGNFRSYNSSDKSNTTVFFKTKGDHNLQKLQDYVEVIRYDIVVPYQTTKAFFESLIEI